MGNSNPSYLQRVRSRCATVGEDFYPTPEHATYQLLKFEDFYGEIWEPACGDGAISKVLEREGYTVRSSDLVDRGYGKTPVDFLEQNLRCDNVITNPPFSTDLIESFVRKSLKLAKKKVAIYVRFQWVSGSGKRHNILREIRPHRIIVLGRIRMKLPNGETRGLVDYCWMVWDLQKPFTGTKLIWGDPK